MESPVSSANFPIGAASHSNSAGSQGQQAKKGEVGEPPPALPIEEDIMQLARLGEVGAIQKLFESGNFDASYRDEQGITPLHWAAIKNHYALCHFLINSGANVDAKGGDVSATPVLWAARSCNYYIVNLLLQHGADPLRTDDQGFNLLQNATMDGNVFQLVLLLHQDIPVDTPDSKGHTSLMWAAYKGFPICVDVLLRWGASVSATDEQDFTALHWALVKGSHDCIQKLIEYGSDRFAATVEGKTPAVVAKEMNSTKQWRLALAHCNYNADGMPKHFPLALLTNGFDRSLFITRFFFLWPTIVLFCFIYILSGLPVFVGAPLALFVAFSLQWLAQLLLQWAPPNMKHIHHTPFLAGIFAGTLFWVGVQWLRKILPHTYMINPFLNLLFSLSYVLCAYFYFLTMLEDPGYVPKTNSRSEQNPIVQELINGFKFNEHTFCVTCMVRKPVRSKHCKRCGRCVVKQDHHCPWVNNCVANNNHRHFFLYILLLEFGVIVLVRLTLSYLSSLPPSIVTRCSILKDDFCAILNKDPFTIITVVWATLQLTWVTMLLFVQLVQISRAQTTYENMKGHPHLGGSAEVVTSAFMAGTTSLDGAEVTAQGRGPDPVAASQHYRLKESWFQQWTKLLGLDTAVTLMLHGSKTDEVRTRQRRNPFARGVITNFRDFFCDPAPVFGRRRNGAAMLGGEKVDYTTMYEPPPRTTMRMARQDGRDVQYRAVHTEDSV